MKSVKLHTYWKKLCEDERRAKLRNEMIMRDLERVDTHMTEMNVKTQRLALMKKQYEDCLSQRYPKWNELLHGSPQQNGFTTDGSQRTSTQHSHILQEINTEIETRKPNYKPHPMNAETEGAEFKPDTRSDTSRTIFSPPSVKDQHQQHQQQQHLWQKQQAPPQDKISLEEDVTKQKTGIGSGIYANLPSLHHDDDTSQVQKTSQTDHVVKAAVSQTAHSAAASLHTAERTFSTTNSTQHKQDKEEEDSNDNGSDSDLPMGRSLGNTQIRVGFDPVLQNVNTDPKLNRPSVSELSIDGLMKLLHVVESNMVDVFSPEDYYRTSLFPSANQKSDLIRKANIGGDMGSEDISLITVVLMEQIPVIVQSLPEMCLLSDSLLLQNTTGLNENTLRTQLSPEAVVVWDALFAHFTKLVKYHIMRPHELAGIFIPHLVQDERSQDKGYKFIVHLLENIVPATNENVGKTKISSPRLSLEESESTLEDGKVPPLKFGSLLDKPFSDDENSSYINSSLPRDAVPLNETKAYKGMVAGMVAGSGSGKLQHQFSGQDDTDDDVEKQVASALAKNSLSHKSPQRKVTPADDPSEASSLTFETSHNAYVPTAMEPRKTVNVSRTATSKFQGFKISSDLDTDTEVDAGILGSSRHHEDNDFDFYD